MDAAVTLLTEHGDDSFTLADVARLAGVSIGSIYGRVDSKDGLIRSVQERELARIDSETTAAFSRIATDGRSGLDTVVASAIRTTGRILRSNAGILGPLMLRANSDPVVAAAGRRSATAMEKLYLDTILARREEILHPDPRVATSWTYVVVYSVFARYLGLGSSKESAGQGTWRATTANLTEMTVSFLTRPR